MTERNGKTPMAIAALIDRARTGDARAFEALVETYQDRIYTYAARMLNDPVEAEDIAQETFLRAYMSLARFRGTASFQTWLYRIAGNLVIDAVRRRRRRDDFTFSIDEPIETGHGSFEREFADERRGPEELADSAVVTAEVGQAVAQLSDTLRPVLVMYDLQGLSYQEIAVILGVPLGTVKSRLYNARIQLKMLLTDLL